MEMDLIDFRAMYLGLRRRDALIDRKRFFLYCLRNRKSRNQTADLRHAMMRMVMRMRRMMMVVFVVVIVLKKSVIARVYMRVTMCGIIAMEMRMLVHIFLYMIVILAVMAMRVFLHMRMRMCMHVMVMFVVVLMYMVMFMFMVVRMRMVMFVVIFLRMRMPTWHSAFLLTMNQHPHMRAGNAALCARLCFKNHARDSHGVQFGKRGFLIRHQFQERCGQHIARRPHRTFDI